MNLDEYVSNIAYGEKIVGVLVGIAGWSGYTEGGVGIACLAAAAVSILGTFVLHLCRKHWLKKVKWGTPVS